MIFLIFKTYNVSINISVEAEWELKTKAIWRYIQFPEYVLLKRIIKEMHDTLVWQKLRENMMAAIIY